MPALAPEIVVKAERLERRYGDFTAVAGIDFEIRRGECFGFLGPNGAGKTTTMRMIYRAAPLGGGRLSVLGHDVGKGESDREIKRRIGVIPQENNLDEELTVRENLEVFARFYRLAPALRRERVRELIEFADLVEKADQPVVRLSGGMKRRALIARGLLGDPALIVLDEPTTGLDPQARHHLWDRLRELKRRSATLILTTHYMDEAERLCDRLVIMDKGKIVALGTPKELLAAHVPPHVVELVLDPAASDGGDVGAAARAAAASLAGEAEKVEALAERVLLYTREAPEGLISRVAKRFPGSDALVRRATLEDVFLKITGRRLED